MSALKNRMAARSIISRAGTRSRKLIGSSGSTGGAERPLKPAVSSPAKTAAHSSPSMSPECGLPCTQVARQPFVKDTARVKAEEHPRARSTILPLKLQKRTPPNARLRHSGNPLVWHSMRTEELYPPRKLWAMSQSQLILSISRASHVTTQPQFHGLHATMADVKISSHGTWHHGSGFRTNRTIPDSRSHLIPLSFRPHLICSLARLIKAFLPLPNPNAFVTKPT